MQTVVQTTIVQTTTGVRATVGTVVQREQAEGGHGVDQQAAAWFGVRVGVGVVVRVRVRVRVRVGVRVRGRVRISRRRPLAATAAASWGSGLSTPG